MQSQFIGAIYIGIIVIAIFFWMVILKSLFKNDKLKGASLLSVITSAILLFFAREYPDFFGKLTLILGWVFLFIGGILVAVSVISKRKRD